MRGRIKREVKLTKVPIIGKLKTGIKVEKNGREFPQSLDYFVADGKYKEYFNREFGEKPSSVEIMFLSDDYTQVCNERFEYRDGAKLYAWGDGEYYMIWDPKAEDYIEHTIHEHGGTIDHLEKKYKKTTTLTITFLVPRIKGVYGAWQLTTRGENSSIPQIVSVFDSVQSMAGTVVGVPFDLQVEKVTSQKPGSKSCFPVVKIVPNISQGHMEKVREFLEHNQEQGKKLICLLTEDRIDEIAGSVPMVPQIENQISKEIEISPEELHVENSTPSGNAYKEAEHIYRSCRNLGDLGEAFKKIKPLQDHMTVEEWDNINIIRQEIADSYRERTSA